MDPFLSATRKTKIIGSLGFASFDPSMIRRLKKAGVNTFRLNFSHIKEEEARMAIKTIRELSDKDGHPSGIIADLQGPKIRIGTFTKGAIQLKTGATFTITKKAIEGNEQVVSTNYPNLIADAKKGDLVLLDDGKLRLKVVRKTKDSIVTQVVLGGELGSRKGMNLPSMSLSAAALTPKDIADVRLAAKLGVDYFALSFVRRGRDVTKLRRLLNQHGSSARIIAKIEKPEALENIEEIIEASDAVMVARGDLGIEINVEKVPQYQKDIIRKVNAAGKPVIVATQMLDSMMHNCAPTRAEVSDVATAVYDWTDAVMLSGETAAGKFPVESVEMMARIASTIDEGQAERKRNRRQRDLQFIRERSVVCAICNAADQLVDEIGAKAILVFSSSGRTALKLAKYRPTVPIIAVTDQLDAWFQMTLFRGVWPIFSSKPFHEMGGIREKLREAELVCRKTGVINRGDPIVIVAGVPIATSGSTNMIRVHTIGEPYQY